MLHAVDRNIIEYYIKRIKSKRLSADDEILKVVEDFRKTLINIPIDDSVFVKEYTKNGDLIVGAWDSKYKVAGFDECLKYLLSESEKVEEDIQEPIEYITIAEITEKFKKVVDKLKIKW